MFYKHFDQKLRANDRGDRLDGPVSVGTNGYEVYFLNAKRSISIYSDGAVSSQARIHHVVEMRSDDIRRIT